MKELCASGGNFLQTIMVDVKFSPNQAYAKLRVLCQWKLLFL